MPHCLIDYDCSVLFVLFCRADKNEYHVPMCTKENETLIVHKPQMHKTFTKCMFLCQIKCVATSTLCNHYLQNILGKAVNQLKAKCTRTYSEMYI